MTAVDWKRRIFIVDDEQDLTDSLAAIFLQHGYDVRVANSAEQAVEMLATWQPELALVDVALPGMNGIDLALAIRKIHPNCRLLLISGQTATHDLLREAAQKGNIFEFLAKPVHPLFMLDYVASRLVAHPSRKLAD
ncbi:MAG TPA: response regulator [Acidobacteriaceae bacterium]|nr:response regulator [Acidobacteriaceae bacterium]